MTAADRDDLLLRIATAWWDMPRGDRLHVASTARGRQLAALLDSTLEQTRGRRKCVCLMALHGHDALCPARAW